jgi:hypothetical protein
MFSTMKTSNPERFTFNSKRDVTFGHVVSVTVSSHFEFTTTADSRAWHIPDHFSAHRRKSPPRCRHLLVTPETGTSLLVQIPVHADRRLISCFPSMPVASRQRHGVGHRPTRGQFIAQVRREPSTQACSPPAQARHGRTRPCRCERGRSGTHTTDRTFSTA